MVLVDSNGSGSSRSGIESGLHLAFPAHRPPEYPPLAEEPRFDARRHLALALPERTWSLAEFGYDPADIAAAPSPVAISTPFRLLSEEGVAAFRDVALQLRASRRTSNRTASFVTGSVYRSRFVRDFCSAPEVTEHMSRIAGCTVLAHSMPSQQAYINYAPDDIAKAVDTWHTDSIGLDYVLMLSDPSTLEGGLFQFFKGTRAEAARFLETRVEGLVDAITRDLPADRVVSVRFPAAGFAIFQQGSHVVHRATALTKRGERITVVPGLVATSMESADPTRDGIAGWGEPAIEAEFARHKAWVARGRLDRLIADLGEGRGPQDLAAALRAAVTDVEKAAAALDACMLQQRSA